MSTWRLRPAALPDDYPRLAAIYTACNPEPVTVEEMAEDDAKSTYASFLRLVGVDADGLVAGVGVVERHPEDQPGQFYVKAWVEPASRGQGLGRALADALEAWALEQGATEIRSGVRDNDPRSLAFARARGLEVDRHLFESTVEPAAFDETPFAGAVERATASGIRFFTLAAEPGDASEQKLYELYNRTAWDIPGFDLVTFPPFDDWRQWVVTGKNSRPDLTLIAADGEGFVGASVLSQRSSGGLYTDYTCVLREYRGRGIALALKLLSIRAARQARAPYLRTNNDSQNGPMLAINRKLGYVPCPGFYRMKKGVSPQ